MSDVHDSLPNSYQVSWVFVAFIWGTLRLVKDLTPNSKMEPLDLNKQAWTFGQVVSIFTLAAPLISIIGTLEKSEFLKSLISMNHF